MTSGAGVMAATEPVLGPESAAPPREEEEGAGPSSGPERNPAGSSSTSEAPRPPPEPSAQSAAIPEAVPPPPAAASPAPELPLRPAPPGSAPRSPSGPDGPRGPQPGPETFRQRFRQFRYHDAAGPWEAFRQLRELSRQWLRPDIRTKEQIVEMLVQEQLLAILPEAARARRLRRRTDVRITG